MASYVLVWENNTFGHMKVKGHTWTGHAAMNIGDAFSRTTGEAAGNENNNYVSWWPGGNEDALGKKALVKSIFKKIPGHNPLTFLQDLGSEGYLPDHVIKLESSQEQEARMLAAWKEVLLKEGGSSFRGLRKNCSTIVSRVLHAGGFYARKWALNCNLVWTPADIRKLAAAAGGTFMTWTDFREHIAQYDYNDLCFIVAGRARSGAFCTTGAPCRFQQDQQQPTPGGGGNQRNGIVLE